MFDNLSGFFATQSKDSSDRMISVVKKDDAEPSAANNDVKAETEAKNSASKSATVLTQTRKAVQAAASTLSENNVSERKDQDTAAKQSNAKDLKEIKSKLDDLNARLESHELNARFTIDEDSNRFVVQLVDSSGQVIRQIPSENSLEFARNAEKGVGVLVDKDL